MIVTNPDKTGVYLPPPLDVHVPGKGRVEVPDEVGARLVEQGWTTPAKKPAAKATAKKAAAKKPATTTPATADTTED